MGSGRTYLGALARMHAIDDSDERIRVARQGLAMLAQLAEREPAPLEGLPADQLLLSTRCALTDGVLADLDWLSPASAAIALFELAQALPPGAERRELGRRVLQRLRTADRETFVRLLVAMARSSPKLLASDHLRARTEVVLAAPLTAPGAIGELALALLAQPPLAQGWVVDPAMGSLPARRLAGRILAHGAREAVRRHDHGDRGGVAVLARPGIRAALARLLGDREALVWRFASVARGLLAHVDSDLAAEIDRELRPSAGPSALRRGAASAAAALERGGAAARWEPVLIAIAAREPGVARGAILGLAGLAVSAPDEADRIATALLPDIAAGASQILDACEALAELRREEAAPLLPAATAVALGWTRRQLTQGTPDDGRWALLHALDSELAAAPRDGDGIGVPLAAARAALDAGDTVGALKHARAAVEDLAAAADWLDRAADDAPLDRRHSMRLLRELDRELLADNTLPAVIALAPEGDAARAQLVAAMGAIEAALLARETNAEAGPVAHGGLRIARLRAIVRLLDGVRASGDAELGPRLVVLRALMARAEADRSPLRRAVWAAMTRAGDALLRDDHAEITDLLLAWTTTFVDEDFAIVREASMVPEVEASFAAYVRLQQATHAASDPDDVEATQAVALGVGDLADALPPEQSPRVESVRLALARLGNQLVRVTSATSHDAIGPGVFDAIATELGDLARRVYGARRRLGAPADDTSLDLEAAARSIGVALEAQRGYVPGPGTPRAGDVLDETIGVTIDRSRAALPPALAAAIERVLGWLSRRPRTDVEAATTTPLEPMLPPWVPLSRQLGGYYVVRPIGKGAGGSVLLAVRADERQRADRELVAVKVPDYSGAAARNLSEAEFEALFREEAGALLVLPAHANLAGFVTFDASARPKPILVMEFVRGINLERTLEGEQLDSNRIAIRRRFALGGPSARHDARARRDRRRARRSRGDASRADRAPRRQAGERRAARRPRRRGARRLRARRPAAARGLRLAALRRRRGVERRPRIARAVPRRRLRGRVHVVRAAHRPRAARRRHDEGGARAPLLATARPRRARAPRARRSPRPARAAAARRGRARSEAPPDDLAVARGLRGDRARPARAEVAARFVIEAPDQPLVASADCYSDPSTRIIRSAKSFSTTVALPTISVPADATETFFSMSASDGSGGFLRT